MPASPGRRVSLVIWAVLVIAVFVVPILYFVVNTITTDNDPSQARSAPFDLDAGKTDSACDLLGVTDLAAAFRAPFDAGVEGAPSALGTISCVWTSPDPAAPITLTATVGSDETIQVALGQLAKQLYEGTRERATVDEPLPIADSAYRAGTTVAVLDGRLTYSFTVSSDAPTAIEALRTLAAQAVAHGLRGLH